MNLILISLITLGLVGAVSSIILYFTAQKFHVFEDTRINDVEEALPSANCGGCGFPGCRAFAEACVKAETMDGLNCPVGGAPTMENVANILGRTVVVTAPTVAVVRCGGTCDHRPRMNKYDGVQHCFIAHNLYSGETGCSFGCLGLGDCDVSCIACTKCEKVCPHEAITISNNLAFIHDDKCKLCRKCVEVCPTNAIVELNFPPRKPKTEEVAVEA